MLQYFGVDYTMLVTFYTRQVEAWRAGRKVVCHAQLHLVSWTLGDGALGFCGLDARALDVGALLARAQPSCLAARSSARAPELPPPPAG